MSEHDFQVAYFDWIKWQRNRDPIYDLIFAVPNSASRSYKTANYFSKEGLTRGVPDVLGLIYNRMFHGFAIEFKFEKGKLKPDQVAWRDRLIANGWSYCLAYNADTAIKFTKDYLTNRCI